MNCANHPEIPAVAYCRSCGKPMCQECQRPVLGSVYCAEHVPEAANVPPPPPPAQDRPATAAGGGGYYAGSPYTASAPPPLPVDTGAHPVLALILGFIPGVGAIYNGQYAKGLIH